MLEITHLLGEDLPLPKVGEETEEAKLESSFAGGSHSSLIKIAPNQYILF